MTSEDLVRMANQIAANFHAYGEDEAVEAIANHLRQFWEPRMLADLRTAIAESTFIAESTGIGLNPLVIAALERP